MGEVKFHIKMPIMVMRQFVRHRTFSLNEVSGRYTELPFEMYCPELDRFKGQSKSNKQMSDSYLGNTIAEKCKNIFNKIYERSYDAYKNLLDLNLSREVSRIALPLATYTEIYVKVDLHNLFHFLKLRLDENHAQEEIVLLARLMYEKVKNYFPWSCEAFEDYQLNSLSFSRLELLVLKKLIFDDNYFISEGMVQEFSPTLSRREISEFIQKVDKIEQMD
jgi:thymidylate synthase (FAD)